jgi:hypothetical protein
MIVDDFNVIRIALAETEAYPPGPVDGHSPLPLAVSFELMKANTPQGTQILEICCGVKGKEQLLGYIMIHPTKL